MKIALIQTEIKDFCIEENYQCFESLLNKVDKDTDLVVLSEMFLTGFITDTSLAKHSKKKGLMLMRTFAKETGIAIDGSLLIEEDNKYFNRHYFVEKDKETYYDKEHLFSLSDEAKVLSKGEKKDVIISYKDFNIKLLTCYDLRFPLSSMNTYNGRFLYDLLIYVASWPQSRREQWLTLLKARAIENQSYVIGVNRVGKDANHTLYSGDSCIINTKGEMIPPIKNVEDKIFYYELNKKELDTRRQKFPTYLDWK
ncbi:MAG: nitrilase family protein [Bacteroidales bacterium]|nr:nitrilase family protein [Bacteroidales bacterium]